MTLRVGVIGCGRMGLQHAKAYMQAKDAIVMMVCDTDAAKAKALAEYVVLAHYHVDPEIVYGSDLDLISIATPDQTHAEIAISALRAGKHVFVEKPAATSSTELEALREAYRSSQRHLSSNLCLRTNPEMQIARDNISALGELEYCIGQYVHNLGKRLEHGWRSQPDYSRIHGGGVHMADLALWIAPQATPVISVSLKNRVPRRHYIHIKGDAGRWRNDQWLTHDATALIHQFVAAVQGGDWPDTLPTAEEVFRGVEICNQIVEGEG